MSNVLRICTSCKGEFPATLEHFYADKQSKSGLQCYCKDCKKAIGRNRFPQNLERKQHAGETFSEGRWIQKHWTDGALGYIQLTRNKIAEVDAIYVEHLLDRWRWYCSPNGYALTSNKMVDGVRLKPHIRMHREVWQLHYGEIPSGLDLDHQDCNKLNNRIANLRLATRTENLRNVGIRSNNTSGVKGVGWDKSRDLWRARIKVNKKDINLGHFLSREDAAIAYAEAALLYYGEFARLR